MNNQQEFVYPLNKTKILSRMLLQVVLIFMFGFFFKMSMEKPTNEDVLLLISSAVAIVFMASAFLLSATMILKKSPGLVINPRELIDNTTGVSVGRIAWVNIAKIYVTHNRRVRFLTIEVYDAEQFLGQGNFISQIFKRVNYTFFRTPIHISADALNISFEGMTETIERYYKRYGRSKSIN